MQTFAVYLMAQSTPPVGEVSDAHYAKELIVKLEKIRHHLGKRDKVFVRNLQETGLGWGAYIMIRKFGQTIVEENRQYTHEQLTHIFDRYTGWKAHESH